MTVDTTQREAAPRLQVTVEEGHKRDSPVSSCGGGEEGRGDSYGLSGEGGDLIDSSSSSEEEEEEEEGSECEKRGKIRERSPLPLPILDGSARVTTSVFSNPYRDEEEAKLDILRQHVDLSQHIEPKKKWQRKWSTKRGKRGRQDSNFQAFGDLISGDQRWNDGDSPVSPDGRQRRHRSGVGESLEPPKKYMKMHHKIQQQERPWTTR